MNCIDPIPDVHTRRYRFRLNIYTFIIAKRTGLVRLFGTGARVVGVQRGKLRTFVTNAARP